MRSKVPPRYAPDRDLFSDARSASGPAPRQGDVGRDRTAPVKHALRPGPREFDTRPVSISAWPAHLKATISLMLPAQAQIVLFWGAEFVALYNDAYAPTIGDKHPRALGRPARENWAGRS
jgi:hypothetical protein